MTALTIRDVPDGILTAVTAHTAQAGKSPQAYAPGLAGETRGQRAVRRARGTAG